MLLRLAALACGLRPETVAISEMRKFSGWLLPGLTGAGEILERLNTIALLQDYRELMLGWLDGLERAGDTRVHPELLPEMTLDTVRLPG